MANWFLIIDVQFFSLNCGFIKFVYMPNKDDEKLKCENKMVVLYESFFLACYFAPWLELWRYLVVVQMHKLC